MNTPNRSTQLFFVAANLIVAIIAHFSVMLSAQAQARSSKIDLNKEGIDLKSSKQSKISTTSSLPDQQSSPKTSNYGNRKVPASTLAMGVPNDDQSYFAQEIVIDRVIASVDGVPITLKEFSDKLVPKRKISIADFSRDPELNKALDAMIMERLIEAEAASKKIKVQPADIERYTLQVAAQNHMTKAEFESALVEQGKSVEEFEKLARLEIMRSRLMGLIAQNAPAVTDQELDTVDGDPEDSETEASDSNDKVRFSLREIVIVKQSEGEGDALEAAQQIYSKLEAGEDFSSLAKEFSRGASAQNGGDLGEVVLDDLSESVRDSVSDLEAGSHTEIIDMDDAFRIFFLEKKLREGEASESKKSDKEHVRKELESRKLESKFQNYFTVELPKLHKVERKVS